jgi:acyl-CoA thioester hydrolase
VGRVELMRQRGLNYKRMEIEEGCCIAVVEASARYKAPARYDDELIVQTTVKSVRGPVIRFLYRILRADDGLLLCEGETVHVVVGREMKRRPMPKKYATLLSATAYHSQV